MGLIIINATSTPESRFFTISDAIALLVVSLNIHLPNIFTPLIWPRWVGFEEIAIHDTRYGVLIVLI